MLIPGVRPSSRRWHCHTSPVGGQVFPPNPRLPSQWDCYSFISRHLGSTRLNQLPIHCLALLSLLIMRCFMVTFHYWCPVVSMQLEYWRLLRYDRSLPSLLWPTVIPVHDWPIASSVTVGLIKLFSSTTTSRSSIDRSQHLLDGALMPNTSSPFTCKLEEVWLDLHEEREEVMSFWTLFFVGHWIWISWNQPIAIWPQC